LQEGLHREQLQQEQQEQILMSSSFELLLEDDNQYISDYQYTVSPPPAISSNTMNSVSVETPLQCIPMRSSQHSKMKSTKKFSPPKHTSPSKQFPFIHQQNPRSKTPTNGRRHSMNNSIVKPNTVSRRTTARSHSISYLNLDEYNTDGTKCLSFAQNEYNEFRKGVHVTQRRNSGNTATAFDFESIKKPLRFTLVNFMNNNEDVD
jgi:hypothetical protein